MGTDFKKLLRVVAEISYPINEIKVAEKIDIWPKIFNSGRKK